jgi:hypothetical protein
LRHHLSLAAVELLAHGPGVPAGRLGIPGLHLDFYELGPQALHLLLGGGPHIIGLHHCSQTAGCGDGLKTRDTCPNDKNPGRSDGPGGGNHHGVHSGDGLGGH